MWKYFQAGGPVMWALLACSIAAVAVMLERFWFWHRINPGSDERAAMRILADMGKDNLPGSLKAVGMLTAMLGAGLADQQNCGKAMEAIALEYLARMRRGMGLLDTIITAAPMLGILGTVLGIIVSFDMLGEAGVSEPRAVIAGIAEALLTTAFGLGIAVACIFPFNWFNSRIARMTDKFEIYASRLELALADQGAAKADAPAQKS